MVYSKTVEIPAEFIKRNRTVKLAFDEIYNVAQVSVNGENVAVPVDAAIRVRYNQIYKGGRKQIVGARRQSLGKPHYRRPIAACRKLSQMGFGK